MNIQSLSAQFDDLVILLDQLNDDTRNIAAILIQESWLYDDSDLSQLQIEGYSLITSGRVCSSHSGLAIYLNDNYKYSILPLYNNSTVWEGLFIEVSGKGLKKPVIIGNVYRPSRNTNNGYQRFINEFTPILSHLDKRNSEIILAGDYNIDPLQINRNRIVEEFFDLLTSHSFYSQITLPTRLSTMTQFLDFSKAFDTLDHTILTQKLKHYGIKGCALKLVKNYFSNRKQYVELNNVKSEMSEIKAGVPQGSILVPLLFVIYVNDIYKASSILYAIIYADDTTLAANLEDFSAETRKDLENKINSEINEINIWLKANRLSLNIHK